MTEEVEISRGPATRNSQGFFEFRDGSGVVASSFVRQSKNGMRHHELWIALKHLFALRLGFFIMARKIGQVPASGGKNQRKGIQFASLLDLRKRLLTASQRTEV